MVKWDDFLAGFDWRQGEHVTLVGPTNAGKTTLIRAILPRRRYSVVFACKPRDPLIRAFGEDGYRVVRTWPPPPPIVAPRVLLWPRVDEVADIPKQRAVFRTALLDVYRRGGYALALDETRYITDQLRLAPLVEVLLMQGRTLGVSVVCATQRPVHIPLLAYDQATHLFLWRESDDVNVRRLKQISGVNGAEVAAAVTALGEHRLLYVNTRTGELVETMVEGRETQHGA